MIRALAAAVATVVPAKGKLHRLPGPTRTGLIPRQIGALVGVPLVGVPSVGVPLDADIQMPKGPQAER